MDLLVPSSEILVFVIFIQRSDNDRGLIQSIVKRQHFTYEHGSFEIAFSEKILSALIIEASKTRLYLIYIRIKYRIKNEGTSVLPGYYKSRNSVVNKFT